MTTEKDGRTSVLASLTQSLMSEKKSAAKALTPVAGEVRPDVLPKTKAVFPNDMPQEVIEQKVRELDRIITHLTEARDALSTLVEQPSRGEAPVDLGEVRKEKERAADFNAGFKAQQAEAQAAIYKAAAAEGVIPVEEILAKVGGDWSCPTHGKAVTKTSSKTGREFVGCPDCNLFKR